MGYALFLIVLGLLLLAVLSFLFYLGYGKYLDNLARRKREVIISQEELSYILQKIDSHDDSTNQLGVTRTVVVNSENCPGFIEVTISDITVYDVNLDSVYKEYKDGNKNVNFIKNYKSLNAGAFENV